MESLITTNYDDGYPLEVINEFKVRVWNMNEVNNKNIKQTKNAMYIRNKSPKSLDKPLKVSKISSKPSNKRSYSTKIIHKQITPLTTPKSLVLQPFMTLDIETMELNQNQIPVLITTHQLNESKYFLIDQDSLKINSNNAVNNLWKEVFSYLNLQDIKYIFVHNLGKFDGIFIFKYLLANYNKDCISPIIDQNNSFVCLSVNLGRIEVRFLDSMRIFPISLDNLCRTFGVEGKLNKYKPEYNELSLFDNKSLLKEWLDYSIQDSVSLFEALLRAQVLYSSKYKVDLTSIVSISSLSFKIFRQDFLEIAIPILSKVEDLFIRKSYFGGSTDYFRKYGKKLYYFDVNSLYPFAMMKPIPHKIIKFHDDLSNYNLDELFGFFKAEIITPKNLICPLLPYRNGEMTIHPTGKFTGIYFSEELKAVKAQGYKIKLISGYEFSKTNLFQRYIEHFYNIKKIAKGAERFISKLHLNTLYGYFGRSFNMINTLIIDNNKMLDISLNHKIKNIYEINDNLSCVLIKEETNNNHYNFIKSNVAIASAVTSYARIEMIKIKTYCLNNRIKIYYTDTDSIFLDKPLPSKFIGDDIGLYKDEMNGIPIEEAYFLGIKQYGYWFYDENNVKVERSIFTGVQRNSLTFKEITNIAKGNYLVKKINTQFFKSFNNMNIRISDTSLTIKRSENKLLKNNKYIPENL